MKTILITGATDGIGRETARQLLDQGHRLLIHGRNLEKAQRTIHDLGAAEKPVGPSAEAVYGDLSDMGQVLDLAEQVKRKTAVLDVLIHNAGVFANEWQLTVDGLEFTMAVNHFAPFLLTHALLSHVQASPQGRFVTVSSIAHEGGRIDLQDLSLSRNFNGYRAYANSKLANVLFTVALSQRLMDGNTTANCLHPGVISTKLLHSGFGITGASVGEGARTSVFLATAPEVGQVSGRYFIDCETVKPSSIAQDRRLAEEFWLTTEAALQPFLS